MLERTWNKVIDCCCICNLVQPPWKSIWNPQKTGSQSTLRPSYLDDSWVYTQQMFICPNHTDTVSSMFIVALYIMVRKCYVCERLCLIVTDVGSPYKCGAGLRRQWGGKRESQETIFTHGLYLQWIAWGSSPSFPNDGVWSDTVSQINLFVAWDAFD